MASLYIFLGLLLLFSLEAPPCSAASDTLVEGQVLSIGDKLVSRNGKFALGFFQPSANISKYSSDNTTSWYLGIWFNKIPIYTVVWVANRERPITEPKLKLTQLKISGDGNLAIFDHDATESTIWSTHIDNRTETSMNTSVVLQNSGNLVIESPSNVVLWQSFDYPTDVALPNAKIGWNKVTRLNRVGVSKKSLIDMGLGSYSVQLYTNGTRKVTIEHRNPSLVYWSWSPDESGMKIPALKALLHMNPQTSGLITPNYVNNSEEEYYSYNSSDESSSTFLLLDMSGQIRFNVWSQDKQSWQSLYVQPVDPCRSYDTCGPFTICNGNAQPFCDCMESFTRKSPQDWDLGDRTGGCSRNTPLDCTGNKTTSSTDMFYPITRVKLPRDPQSIQEATVQSKCAETCLSSCSCTAYSFQNGICSIWHGELFSVNQNDGIEIHSEDVLYLRLAAKDLQTLRTNKRKPNVGVVTAASITSFMLLMVMFFLLIWRNRFKWCGVPLHNNEASSGIKAFRYTDLVHATKNFSEKLGAGGFGSVFKGILSDSTTIAVKRLDGARQGEKQFRAEVSSIGLIQHINLVKLIGFCCEGHKRLLAYEHMLNGSLDAHLFQSNGMLSWSIRYHIALGVARGLAYLHQSCHECIIHCDIKPQNILLDASFTPKIADFGMAAFVGRDFSRILTTFRGTVGYLAPEWISGVAVTPKVDVYSFGMVLLEIVSGRRNSAQEYISDSCHVSYFPVQAIEKLHQGDVRNLVDPRLHDDCNSEEVERVCKVACWCIQDNELDRPTMSEVVRVLEGLQELDMPPMPRLLAALTKCSIEAKLATIAEIRSDLNDTLLAGQVLTVSDKLVSRNGKFTLGFFQQEAGTSKSDGWYLGIWFSKILFGWNKRTGLNRQGISWKSLIDPGLGSYSVELDTNGTKGVIQMLRDPPKVYWYGLTSPTLVPELRSLVAMNPRTRGLIIPEYVDNAEEEYYMYTSPDGSSSSFLSLDMSGQIKLNYWQIVYAHPADPCNPFATCGPFTICNGISNPVCDCMESFTRKSPRDWNLGDRTGGCTRNTPLNCTVSSNKTSSSDMFRPIAHVKLPYNSENIQDAIGQSKCAQACLDSCSCTAYAYQNSKCSVWHGDLFSVNENDGIENHSDYVLYLRLAAKDLQFCVTNAHSVGNDLEEQIQVVYWCAITQQPRYSDLVHATKNFSKKLGAGGFGSVFKGVLRDLTIVAVKRLDGARQGEKQFRAEVSSIGLIQHINLVKLIGFCCQGDKRLLVYEHMLNGSLDAHLLQSNPTVLNWSTRYQIALGVARGLSYLHQSCRECIIHCDIKPQNILLDESFTPKIADFGMAVFVGRDFSRVMTTFRGTIGYLAPEWISGVAITPKVDVYSYGMVLLEIISGMRNLPNVHSSNSYHAAYFPVRAINKLHEGDVPSLVDPQLSGDFNLEEVERVCKVACWCIQDNEFNRPTMGEVVLVLDGLQEFAMPPMPKLLAALTSSSDVATM
uniref:non-specific serine/threonine protein kinase n=1 Tax=Leersia perrieri TaxID=77586 RepID=A0A0D9W1R5_9ORYZ